jgi:DNA primase
MLYDKSNVLYGINNAKLSIRKNNQAVLTEGYTDAIMAQQAGFENTVAVSGTALTGRHLGLLKRYSDNLLLSFDMDAAGDNATKRGINLAESQGFNIKVIKSYTEKDPADIIKDDPKTWEEAVTNARPIMDYYFDSSFAKYDKTNPDGKKQIGKIILPAIKRLQNKIEQSHWVQKLAGMLQVSETSVLEELKNIKDDAAYAPSAEVMAPAVTLASQPDVKDANGRKKLIEDKIVSLVLKDPENLNLIEEPHFAFFCDNTQNFIKDLKTGVADKEKYKNFFDTLALRAEVEYQEEDGCQEIQLCLLQLKDIELRNSLAQLSEAIRHEVDQQKKEYLIKEFDKKARELHQKS